MTASHTKNIRAFVLITVFLAMTAVPGIMFLFTDKTAQVGAEQRELAEAPELSLASIETFPADFEAYYNDHLPFRSDIVQADAVMDFTIFHTIDSDRVALGEDNWLYYRDRDDFDPLSAYAFGTRLTEEELAAAAANIQKIQKEAQEAGAAFYFMLVPNKEEAVPGHLPKGYAKRSADRAMLQLADYLRAETDVPVIDVSAALAAAAENHQIFMKYDTHWNAVGGYAASQELLTAMGIEPISLSHLEVHETARGGGDLSGIAGLTPVLNDDPVWRIDGYKENVQTEGTPEYAPVVSMISDAPTDRSLVMYGDSFMEAMMPYLAKDFRTSEYILGPPSVAPADLPELSETLTRLKPTDVVLECVERYIPRLVTMGTSS